jgi:hypothetical protein
VTTTRLTDTFTPFSVTAGVLELTLVSESDGSTRRHNHFHSSSIITSYLTYYYSSICLFVHGTGNVRKTQYAYCGACPKPLLPWKKISFASFECVSVALLIQHAKRMHHIFICSLTLTILSHYLIKDTIFGKKIHRT